MAREPLLVRNEETRFIPATLHAAHPLRAPAFRITMLSIDSIRLAIRRRTRFYTRPYFTQPSSRLPDYQWREELTVWSKA